MVLSLETAYYDQLRCFFYYTSGFCVFHNFIWFGSLSFSISFLSSRQVVIFNQVTTKYTEGSFQLALALGI